MIFRGPQGLSCLESDHVVPYSVGGLTIWSNLVLLCKSCNVKKSARSPTSWCPTGPSSGQATS